MSAIQQMLLASGAPAENRVFSYIANANSTSDLTTYTFSAQSVGVAAVDRYIVVCVHLLTRAGGDGGISSVSVGGITATQAVVYTAASLESECANTGIYYVALPTGTTANIVVNTISSYSRACAVSVYRLTGYNSLAVRAVGTASQSYYDMNTISVSPSLTGLQAGDTCIFAASINSNASMSLATYGTLDYSTANTQLGFAAMNSVAYADSASTMFIGPTNGYTVMSGVAVAFH